MIMDRISVLFLLGVVAAARLGQSESFLLKTFSLPGECTYSTEVSLFRRKSKKDIIDATPPPSSDPINASNNEDRDNYSNRLNNSRRSFLTVTTVASASLLPRSRRAFAAPAKLTGISDDELKQIILSDILEKSFLVTADLTRTVYDENATFTDEIDEYTMDKWIKGTKSLFVPSGSRVSLVGDVQVSKSEVSFRFDEDLMFNIPFKPVCSLSGRVVLTRDSSSGLITSYREYWDQSVNEVLKTAKFGKKA